MEFRALGCTQTACDLCESNPKRGCISDFDKKYFKGDVIKAKCGGAIYLELLDRNGEQIPIDKMVPDALIELSVLDGNRFEQMLPNGVVTPETAGGLETCMLVFDNEGRPVLHSDEKTHARNHGKILVPVTVRS